MTIAAMFDWLPWVKAARQRQAVRDAHLAKKEADRAAVKAAVAATPYKVTQNADGTWCAWRCYADSRYFFSVGLYDFVTWIEIERAEALPTREKAQAAIRRYISGRAAMIGPDGQVVK